MSKDQKNQEQKTEEKVESVSIVDSLLLFLKAQWKRKRGKLIVAALAALFTLPFVTTFTGIKQVEPSAIQEGSFQGDLENVICFEATTVQSNEE